MIHTSDILEIAASWYARNCVETSANRGVCVDEIHSRFDVKWLVKKRSEAWCAKYVWVVFEQAAQMSGSANPLPKTAGARDMLERSKKLMRVDKKPQEGDVFYRRSSSPGATGHVGIVTDVASDGLTTNEGNLDNRVAYYHYTWANINDPSLDFLFIHAADTSANGDTSSAGSAAEAGANGLLALILISAAAGWFFSRRGKR